MGRGTAGVVHHAHPALMDHDVVTTAQERESVDIRGPSCGPRDEVMGIEVATLVAAGERAGGVAQAQGSALGTGGETLLPAQVQGLSPGVGDHERDLARAGEALGRRGLERSGPERTAARKRSRGNVRLGGAGRSRGNVLRERLGPDLDDHEVSVFAGAVVGLRAQVGAGEAVQGVGTALFERRGGGGLGVELVRGGGSLVRRGRRVATRRLMLVGGRG